METQIHTNQEIFDKVTVALLKQGCKSQGSTFCLYRQELKDGTVRKCGAGHLIPDDKYDPSFEGGIICDGLNDMCDTNSLLVTECFKDLGYTQDNLKLIRKLQSVHDSVPVNSWIESFKNLAHAFKLECNFLRPGYL